jgi:hypothetical protein
MANLFERFEELKEARRMQGLEIVPRSELEIVVASPRMIVFQKKVAPDKFFRSFHPDIPKEIVQEFERKIFWSVKKYLDNEDRIHVSFDDARYDLRRAIGNCSISECLASLHRTGSFVSFEIDPMYTHWRARLIEHGIDAQAVDSAIAFDRSVMDFLHEYQTMMDEIKATQQQISPASMGASGVIQ